MDERTDSLPLPPGGSFRDMEDVARAFSVFDCTPFLAGLTTLEGGHYLLVNRRFHEATGYSPGEVLGKTATELGIITAEWRNYVIGHLRERGALRDSELRIRVKDGRHLWCIFNVHPVLVGDRKALLTTAVDITARKEAEEALEEGRRRFEELASAFPGVISQARVNPDGSIDIPYISPGAEEFYGIDPSTGGFLERFLAHVHEEDRARCAASVMGAAKTGEPWEFLGRFVRPDGRAFWLEAKARPMWKGGILHFNGIFLDVTDRVRAEEALAESRRLLDDLAANLPGMVYQSRADGDGSVHLTYLSPGAKEFNGLDEEPGGYFERFMGRVHDEDRESFLAAIRDAVEREAPLKVQLRYVHPDGQTLWIANHAVPFRLGSVLHYNGIALDVTEQRRAEEGRREAEERYRLLVETTGTGYVIIDGEGRVLDANLEYVRLTGRSRLEEILGRPVTDWTAPHDLERNAAEIAKFAREGALRGFEVDYVSPAGKVTPVEVNATAHQGSAGLLTLGLCRDISDRRRDEAALRASEERFQRFLDNLPAAAFLKDAEGRVILGNRYCRDEVWGKDVTGMRADEFFPEAAARLREEDRRSLDGETFRVEETLLDAKGEPRRFVTIRFPVPTREGTLAGGVAIDVTDRVRAEEALRESEERFHLFLDHFPAVAMIKDGEGRILLANRYVKDGVWGRDLTGRFTQEFRTADAERVAADDRRALSGDVQRLEETVPDAAGVARRFRTIKFPIPTARGTLLGVVAVDDTERRRAEDALRESEERIRRLASHEREAVEEERGRIAREIHDELAQRLTAFNMDLHWLRRHLSPDSAAEAGPKLEEMIGALDATRRAVAQIVREMRPPILDDLGLAAALEWMAGDVAGRAGLAVDLNLPSEEMSLPSPVSTAAYRIVQEALTNVVRHAEASHACVSVDLSTQVLRICVCDDGCGLGPGAAEKAGSHGLAGISERLRPLGGSMEISGAAGEGTKLTVAIPLGAPGGGGTPPPASFPAPCAP